MLKFEINRRHLVGLSALAAALAVLGYVENRDFGARRTAALPESVISRPAQNDESGFENRFLSGLKRLPENAYGSAKALLPKAEEATDKAASNAWSDQDWRVAAKAVADFHTGSKPKAVDLSAIKWRPPEEIAAKTNGGSR